MQDQNDVLATRALRLLGADQSPTSALPNFGPVFLGGARIIAARSKSARDLYPPTSANLTCPLSRRRSRGRERHRAIDDQREGRASDIIEDTCPRSTPTCRRSWPTLEASASRPNAGIARSFGRRTAGPPAALALPENAGLSAPDSHLRRHRQDHGARRPSARNKAFWIGFMSGL